MQWLLEQYRSQGAQGLVNSARLAAAQFLIPPPATLTAPQSAASREPATPRREPEEPPQDVLAGMCADLALRDLNLVDALLAQLENMEANEGDPDALARLYQLDHLATRVRRNAENLRVLAGQDAGGVADKTSSLVDVLRAAMSSIAQYTRIEIGWVAGLGVVDFAADDVSRLLAELLDNATAHSPPTSIVTVSAHVTEQGSVLLRVEDAGIGLPIDRLRVLNARLSTAPVLEIDPESIEHMGLAVIRRLADKHGIRVRLDKRAPHGTTASVLLPTDVVCEAPPTPWSDPEASASALVPPRAVPVRRRSVPDVATAGGATQSVGPGRHAMPPSPRTSPDSPSPDSPSPDSPEPAVMAGTSGTPPTGTSMGAPATTRNGLPRRVPHSLRDSPIPAQQAPSSPIDEDSDRRAGQEQLIADLDAFSAGEQEAQEARRDHPRSENPEQGSHQ
jgi:anti-sigma regulatory factor (Ser/Thr protein kinase)